MPRFNFRFTQWSCIAMTALGLVPWALLVGALMLRAIDSRQPLTLTLATWLVLLVPLWVIAVGIVAWQKRDESVQPALLMGLPLVPVAALFFILPDAVAQP